MLTVYCVIFFKGFDVAVAEKALVITKNQGVQPAMDWYKLFCFSLLFNQDQCCHHFCSKDGAKSISRHYTAQCARPIPVLTLVSKMAASASSDRYCKAQCFLRPICTIFFASKVVTSSSSQIL